MTVDTIITFIIGGNVAEQIHIVPIATIVGLFWGLILVTYRSLWVSLCSSKRSYLVSFRSLLGLAQGETKIRPKKTQTRPSRPQLDPKETHSRPKGDLFATSGRMIRI
jgi:hypothetical protein